MPAASLVGPGKWSAAGSETNQGASSFVEITGVPAAGAIIRVKVELTGGSATEVNPSITPTNASATLNPIYRAVDPANRVAPQSDTYVDEAGKAVYVATVPTTPSIFLWFGLDAGSDNSVTWSVATIDSWD